LGSARESLNVDGVGMELEEVGGGVEDVPCGAFLLFNLAIVMRKATIKERKVYGSYWAFQGDLTPCFLKKRNRWLLIDDEAGPSIYPTSSREV
jgi:hypothetical protein